MWLSCLLCHLCNVTVMFTQLPLYCDCHVYSITSVLWLPCLLNYLCIVTVMFTQLPLYCDCHVYSITSVMWLSCLLSHNCEVTDTVFTIWPRLSVWLTAWRHVDTKLQVLKQPVLARIAKRHIYNKTSIITITRQMSHL